MTNSHVIAEQFFDGANAMRAAFEEHFRDPARHTDAHQVWNYWFVPDLYTYLRTAPTKIMPDALVARFMQRLNAWALATLGLSTRDYPWLSVYINGCSQTLHNDSLNGQMGYVFSLTKWDTRNFLGGETLLFHPENYWETNRITTSGAGAVFYEKIPARFNQLLVFDDRIIHGVQAVQGTMDPLFGRLVIHGHLRAESAMVNGSLDAQVALQAIRPTMEAMRVLIGPLVQLFHGFLTVRLMIQPDGRVTTVQTLCDRLMPVTPDRSRLEPLRQEIIGLLAGALFPPTAGPSEFTLPIVIGT